MFAAFIYLFIFYKRVPSPVYIYNFIEKITSPSTIVTSQKIQDFVSDDNISVLKSTMVTTDKVKDIKGGPAGSGPGTDKN